MEPIKAELVENKRKSDARRRKLVAAERRAELQAAYAGSGLTQRAFARREGINFHTFIGWLHRQRGSRSGTSAVRFEEVSIAAAPKAVAPLEVVLPGGWIVRGQEIAAVAELVRALRS